MISSISCILAKARPVSILLLFLFIHVVSYSQGDLRNLLEGNWEGAFIKGRTQQRLDISFYSEGKTLQSLQVIEDWHPQFGEFVLPAEIDSAGNVSMSTGYGQAKLQMDTLTLELIGALEETDPVTYIHLKKVPQKPVSTTNVTLHEIKTAGLTLQGHLHQPKFNDSKTLIINVGGRGCYAGATQYDLYGKTLSPYGISTFAYHKRGTGNSEGDCDAATIDDLAKDLAAVKEYFSADKFSFEKIGVIGSSAGGWVIMKASEISNFDFYVSVVGPSTSVYEQQMESLEEGIGFFDLSDEAKQELIEYTDLVFDAPANKKSFKRFNELLLSANEKGWVELLADTDVPKSIAGIDSLWVRRHNYDPKEALEKCEVPFLAIYGGNDWIVPYKSNVKRLEETFTGSRRELLTTAVIPLAGHSTEVEEGRQNLDGETSYWRFFQISPYARIALIDFLVSRGLTSE